MMKLLAVPVFAASLAPLLAAADDVRIAPPVDVTAPIGANGIIGAEHRKLVADFTIDGAADQGTMRAGLGATQRLSCGASASLIYRSDVIIFSAHQFIEDGTPNPDFPNCFFEVARRTGENVTLERYPLLLATLDYGPLKPNSVVDDEQNENIQNDWAVVRLGRPVEGIEPYRLPQDANSGSPGDPITTVSGTTDNWGGSSQPGDMLAQNCHIIATTGSLVRQYPGVMHLDCDAGRGASGSAVLRDAASGSPTYLATTIAHRGNHCQHAGLTTCFSIARRLDADLIARIEGTTAIRPTPRDAALGRAQEARLAARREKVAEQAQAALVAADATQDDPTGRRLADLDARIKALVADGRAAETDALFLDAFRLLHDPGQGRPEWLWLFIENGDSMLLQRRQMDAFQCYRFAFAIAPAVLKPYLHLRLAQSAAEARVRRLHLREAYLAGGDALFLAAKANAELAEIKADGIPTTDNDL